MQNKNVLLIVIDCLGSDFIFKPSSGKYPCLDQIKKEGICFPNVIAASTITVPCFTSLLTGCYSLKHGIKTQTGFKLNPQVPLLVQAMKDAGYYTVAELTGPFIRQDVGFAKFFDEYNLRDRTATIHTDWLNKQINKLKLLDNKKPWFVLLHIWSLHAKRQIPENFNSNKYGATDYERALSAIDQKLNELLRHVGVNTVVLITGDHGEQIAKNSMDHLIKKVINICLLRLGKIFKNNELFKKNMIKLQRKFAVGHGYNLYDPLIKIPLMIKKSNLSPCMLNNQIRQIDIFPTILGLLDIPLPVGIDGTNVLDFTAHKKTNEKDLVAYIELCGIVLPDESLWLEGIRTNKYKLIRNVAPKSKISPELYNLEKDPQEKNNLFFKQKEIVKKLEIQLDTIKKSSNSELFPGEKMSEEDIQKIKKNLESLGYF